MNTNNRLSWLCRLGTSVVCVTASAASDHQEDVRGRGIEKKKHARTPATHARV